MKHAMSVLATLAILVLSWATAQDGLDPVPPTGYVNASEILPLPRFIPGAGELWIDPANAPIGPWLSYGNDGTLIEVLFMIPVAQMQEASNWDDLAVGTLESLGISTVNHVDVTFNGGHPGMAEAHYHFRLVLVGNETQQAALTE